MSASAAYAGSPATEPRLPALPSAEASVLVLCARIQMDAGHRAAIARLLPGADWERLLELAQQNRVLPLLRFHLGRDHAAAVPPPVAARMEQTCRAALQRSLLLTQELLRIAALFQESEVAVYPYKGPGIAYPAYGDLSLREFDDLDLLIGEHDVKAAQQLMAAAGYQPSLALDAAQQRVYLRSASDLTFVRPEVGAQVDLHWRVLPSYFAACPQMPVLLRRTAQVQVGGRTLAALSPEATLLALSAHAFKHAWNRLAWVADIAQWLAAFPRLDWQETEAMAAELGWRRMVRLAVALADEMLEAPLSEAMRRSVQEERGLDRLTAPAMRNMFFPFTQEAQTISRYLFFWRGRERWSDRLRYLGAARPGIGDWPSKPLPRGLFFLYPVVKMWTVSRRLAASAWHGLRSRR